MLKVLIPPVSEQVQIVKAIKEEYAKIDASIPVFEKQIALLKEYRTRLISDVVTGQMDVRNIEIPEFEAEVDFEADAGNETDEDDDTMNEEATTDE
jgi:type I restriction enzyme, S subunit